MKKLLLSFAMAVVYVASATAQNVIRNNYDSSSSSTTQTQQQTENVKEFIGAIGLHYYSFDGFENWGFGDDFLNPDGFGGEFTIRANFEDHGNVNIDLAPNYCFQLMQKDKTQILLTLAVGPSIRVQDEFSGLNKYGNAEYDNKVFIDGFLSPRISFVFNKFILSAGYYYWAPQFKFSKDDGATGGFHASIAFDI